MARHVGLVFLSSVFLSALSPVSGSPVVQEKSSLPVDVVQDILKVLHASPFCSSFINLHDVTLTSTLPALTGSTTTTLVPLTVTTTTTVPGQTLETTVSLPGPMTIDNVGVTSTTVTTAPDSTLYESTTTTVTNTVTTTTYRANVKRDVSADQRRTMYGPSPITVVLPGTTTFVLDPSGVARRDEAELARRNIPLPPALKSFASSVISSACSRYVTAKTSTTSSQLSASTLTFVNTPLASTTVITNTAPDSTITDLTTLPVVTETVTSTVEVTSTTVPVTDVPTTIISTFTAVQTLSKCPYCDLCTSSSQCQAGYECATYFGFSFGQVSLCSDKDPSAPNYACSAICTD